MIEVNAMKDVQSHWMMWLKGGLFLVVGIMSGGLLLLENSSWRTILLLGFCVWGFCRAYFFAFYVINHWVDPSYRFSGLGRFLVEVVSGRFRRK